MHETKICDINFNESLKTMMKELIDLELSTISIYITISQNITILILFQNITRSLNNLFSIYEKLIKEAYDSKKKVKSFFGIISKVNIKPKIAKLHKCSNVFVVAMNGNFLFTK
jgi:hypothetical protein